MQSAATNTSTCDEIREPQTEGVDRNLRAASKKNRVYVFRNFLRETYYNGSADAYLQPGDLVLDVAGGKGDLSWLFQNHDGLKSVVMDPRSLPSTSHLIRTVHWLGDREEERLLRVDPNLCTHHPLAGLIPEILKQKEQRIEQGEPDYLEPRHLKMKLNDDLVNAVRTAMQETDSSPYGCPLSWKVFWDQTMQAENSASNQSDNGDNLFLPESERKKIAVTAPIQDASEAWKVFQTIRLIVGFHPDQATESICDLAALLNLPLCIVPCCVFPSEFPERKVGVKNKHGMLRMVRVRDYHQLVQYLENKYPQLRKATLPFRYTAKSYTGTPLKNVALFTLPEDIQIS